MDLSTVPDLGLSPYDSISVDDIIVEGAANFLTNHKGHKAHGHSSTATERNCN